MPCAVAAADYLRQRLITHAFVYASVVTLQVFWLCYLVTHAFVCASTVMVQLLPQALLLDLALALSTMSRVRLCCLSARLLMANIACRCTDLLAAHCCNGIQ